MRKMIITLILLTLLCSIALTTDSRVSLAWGNPFGAIRYYENESINRKTYSAGKLVLIIEYPVSKWREYYGRTF